ncbi:MAG: C40 family peptidase [Nitrospirae bacterium]|nr:C40 family peptidase [Nitrospirota bacterium]
MFKGILIFLSFSLIFVAEGFAESYRIKKGDTLYSISKKYKLSIEEIKEVNGLEDDSLRAGEFITIPVPEGSPTRDPKFVEEVNASNQGSVEAEETSGTEHRAQTSALLRTVYIVKKEDTLSRIARDNGLTVRELKRLNDLKSSAVKLGQRLNLYVKDDAAPSTEMHVSKVKSKRKIEIDEAELENLDEKERVVLFAKKFLNIPYRFGGTTLMGIDCSAYVQKVYNFFNIPLPRTAREQFNVGDGVDKDDLTIGDLVFFKTYATFPSHVGIYIGNDLFIHASRRARKVKISNLNHPYYVKRFIGAKRIFEPEEGKDNLNQPS